MDQMRMCAISPEVVFWNDDMDYENQDILGIEFMGEILAQLGGQAYKYRLFGKW